MVRSIQIEKPVKHFPWKIILLLIVGLALLALPFIFIPTRTQPPLELANFVGQPEVYQHEKGTWVPAERGMKINIRDKIRTGDKVEADLRLPDKMTIRLKPSSQLEAPGVPFYEKDNAYRLNLKKGDVLVSTEKSLEQDGGLKMSTPVMVAAIRSTMFQLRHSEETQQTWLGVLRGKVEAQSKDLFQHKSVMVESLEKAEIKKGDIELQPMRISREEWDGLKETYELIQKSAAMEAAQLDLSKSAGNLFEYVYDHGTFYMPKIGFAGREFMKDETANETILETEYDVFPTAAFTGVYILTRDLDLSKFQAFEFEVRRKPGERFPDQFRIELKSKGDVLRGFSPKTFKNEWQLMSFPLNFTRKTPITEFTFVFANDKVGEYKRGALQFKNFTLVPAPPRPEGEEGPADAPAAPQEKAPPVSEPAAPRVKVAVPRAGSGPTKVSLLNVPKASDIPPPPPAPAEAEEKTA